MTRIIINADDLGKSKEVNHAIGKALNQGVITSSTIMANTQLWDEIHRIVESHAKTSFGIHLNLTEGMSLTNSPVLRQYGITDKSNFFTGEIRKVEDLNDELSNAIYNELAAQVDKVKNKENIPVSHIDGHHHIHSLTPLSSIMLKVAKENGITRIRNRYTWPHAFPHYGFSNKIKDYLWRQKFNTNGIAFTDYFGSANDIITLLRQGRRFSPNTIIELMCHPGHIRYQEEYTLVENREIEKYINPIQYINYLDF